LFGRSPEMRTHVPTRQTKNNIGGYVCKALFQIGRF
jgi:ribosomal protein S17E